MRNCLCMHVAWVMCSIPDGMCVCVCARVRVAMFLGDELERPQNYNWARGIHKK